MLCDFLLPSLRTSASFYSAMQDILDGTRAEALDKHFNAFVKHTSCIPYFPIPTVTRMGVFRQYNFKAYTNTHSKKTLVQKIRIEEGIATEANRALVHTVYKMLGKYAVPVRKSLDDAFAHRKIWPVKEIEKYCTDTYPALYSKIKWSNAKNMLACVAFTYATGPWKKLWVQYGYNATADPLSYRYQVYVWKNVSKAFAIMDNKKILSMLEADKSNITTVYSAKTGFITQKGWDTIHTSLSQISIPKTERKNDALLLDALDFETLDE